MFAVWCVSLLLSFAVQVKCAKILGIFHIPSVSHQVVFQPIWRELSLRGHEVTIMSPNTLKDPSLTNLTEVDLSSLYGGLGDLLTKIAKGMDHWEWTEEVEAYSKVNVQQVFGHSEVQAFIKDNSRHFDVVLTEAIYPAPAVFAYKFRCPWIGIASLDVVDPLHQLVGTPTHPVLYPELSTTFGEELSFFERLDAVLFYWYRRYLFFYDTVPSLNKEIKRYFGNDAPDLIELCKNMSMLFLNTNPIIHKPRPFGPNVVQMGGRMHLKPKKPLPLELKEYLDNSTEGVIYFSLGSNVRSSYLDANKRKIITQVFSELPYQILWKFETDNLEDQPKNVKIKKWLPQHDLLGHPNIKLFITQGGLQSLEESVTSGVPLLAIPFFADQFINAGRIEALGFGLKLDFNTLTKEVFKASILEIIENKRYKENAVEIGRLLNDESATGLEKAVWWIEYVIRNKGAVHFRNRVIDMSWFEYLVLDVHAFLAFIGFLLIYVVCKMIQLVLILFRSFNSEKLKTL